MPESKIALGTWSWGAGDAGGDQVFGNRKTEEELEAVFDAAMRAGLNAWDMATVYGMGASEEMEASGTADTIRADEGNLAYRCYSPMDDPECVLLVDRWRDQAALDAHYASSMMARIAQLREKYDLHMRVERFANLEDGNDDKAFIRE